MKSRIIARLDIKNNTLIKGVHLEGLRVVGDPVEQALKYYLDGVDEILLVDAVASLYGRNQLTKVVESICSKIFVPITVGGGIRSIDDATVLFQSGADKIAVNTAAHADPGLLKRLSSQFGAQSIVLSVQAKRESQQSQNWFAMMDNGREQSGLTVDQWIAIAHDLGIGEILLTSIDKDGTYSGYDLELLTRVRQFTQAPLLISGGFRDPVDALNAFRSGAQGAVIASTLHYHKLTVQDIKSSPALQEIELRHGN